MSKHLQHAETCEVQREMYQAANSGQRNANITTFLRGRCSIDDTKF